MSERIVPTPLFLELDWHKYDMVMPESERIRALKEPGCKLYVSFYDMNSWWHNEKKSAEALAFKVKHLESQLTQALDPREPATLKDPFEERISIPLLDWEEYAKFRKSWVYRLWRTTNGKR